MPGYTTRPKKGQRHSKRHHRAASSPLRREVTPTQEELEQDPVCAAQLSAARTCTSPEMAEMFREGAVRIWRHRHSSPSRALSPPRASAFEISATDSTPETEFGEDSEEEEEEEYPPSIYSAPTVDYVGEGEEEEEYPPSIYSAPTIDYGGEGEEEEYPPSVYDETTVDYGEEEEEEPESEEEDYLPPPVGLSPAGQELDRSTVDYGAEDYSPSVVSGVYDSDPYTEDEEESLPSSAGTVKGRSTPGETASSGPSRASPMDYSRGESPAQSMEGVLEGEEEPMDYGEELPRAAPGRPASYAASDTSASRAAPGAFARRDAPGASARRAAPGGGFAAGAGGGLPNAAPAAPDLSPLLALLLARSLAPMSCVCVPVFVSLPLCVPNPFFPLVPLCVNVPVCVFVNMPFNVFNVFSPVFPGRVC
ncbi:uncharacterized protein LOC143504298 [Brachyhypopomus gauderio]|uniref:uncharacterized protein LOC143495193 n=1 Tax=Brachyhypopomus gauderio TaxID=698409 RepID=UPI00404336D9